MIDFNWKLTEYLGQTTIDAAAAGLQLIDWIINLDNCVVWHSANGHIQFQAGHPFCTLQPTSDYIACIIYQNGRSHTTSLAALADVNADLKHHVQAAFQYAQSQATMIK